MLGFFVLCLVMLLLFCGVLLFWKFFKKSHKKKGLKSFKSLNSSFECGFESSQESRQPFSLRFFFILILFMIFDVELGLLLQLPYHLSKGVLGSRFGFFLFFVLLFLGLFEEWRRGLLNWKN